jgi:3-phosphoshikimate 1-carboxyvinyltransferase
MGKPRMHERPIRDLVEPLRRIGARIDIHGNEAFPPLGDPPGKHPAEGHSGRGGVSSQYLSALLMALPLAGGGTVEIEGELISKPYVTITLNMMRKFGIEVTVNGWQLLRRAGLRLRRAGGDLRRRRCLLASYFLAAGAIAAGRCGDGRRADSIQGDVRFTEVLGRWAPQSKWAGLDRGVLGRQAQADRHGPEPHSGRRHDCGGHGAVRRRKSAIRNIGSWQVKETDRITAMARELRKLGATVVEGPDFLKITPPAKLTAGVAIDHLRRSRIAMCFSLAALGGVPVCINDPDCVAKTFPGYFVELAAISETPRSEPGAGDRESTAPRLRQGHGRQPGRRPPWDSTTWKAARSTGWSPWRAERHGKRAKSGCAFVMENIP